MTIHDAAQLLIIFGEILLFFIAIPLGIAIYKWMYFRKPPYRWLFYYLLIYFLLTLFLNIFIDLATKYYAIVGPYLQKMDIYNTFFLEPFFYINQILFLGLFCSSVFQKSKIGKSIRIIACLLCLFIIINSFFGEGYQNYQSISDLLTSIFLIVIAIILLKKMYVSNTQKSILRSPYFWVALGIIINTCGGSFIGFISNRMYNDSEIIFYQAHVVADIFYDIALICFARAAWLVPWEGKLH